MTEPAVQIGPYTITRELGLGGMSVVYLARDARLEAELPESLTKRPTRVPRRS